MVPVQIVHYVSIIHLQTPRYTHMRLHPPHPLPPTSLEEPVMLHAPRCAYPHMPTPAPTYL